MGNSSWFIHACNGADVCMIDWDNIDQNMLLPCYRLYVVYKSSEVKSLEDIGNLLDGSYLYGHLDTAMINSFKHVCEHLLPCRSFPRLYFEYEGWDLAFYLEFYPGTKRIVLGTHDFTKLRDKLYPNYSENFTEEEETKYEEMCENARKELYNLVPIQQHWLTRELN